MPSLSEAIQALQNQEVTVWLQHPDMKMLGGIVDRTAADHFELLSGDTRFYIAYAALVAISPTA